MSNSKCCACGSAPKLTFSCSGAADVGEVADQASRKLTREGCGSMFCLAGIGGGVPGILKSTEAAASVLAIDGCALDCAKKSLEAAGFERFDHLRLSDLGLDKGKTEVAEPAIALVMDKAKTFLL